MVTARRDIALPTYRVSVGAGIMSSIAEIVEQAAPAHRYAVITDSNVGPRYARDVSSSLGASRTSVLTIPAGEEHKTRDTWSRLTDELLDAGFGRDTTIIALGGGVVGDVAGFVAATFMRGVPYVQVPTSLLAMIDASVGGKTGVDTPAGKNLVGAFHQPAAVVADMTTLATLPAEHLRAGLAEAIKHGVIADAAYLDEVEQFASTIDQLDVTADSLLGLVARSIEIKAAVVRNDERETGLRKTLNFGHTIGHAIELCTRFQLLHGNAVAIGMVCEAAVAERIGVAADGTADRIGRAVRAAGLPDRRPPSLHVDEILRATRGDKKARAGRAEYALPDRIGHMSAAGGWSVAVDDETVRAVLA